MRVSGDRRLELKNCYLFSLFLETSSFLLKCNSEVCRTVTHTQRLPAPIDICILFSSLALPFLRCLLKSEICSAAFFSLLFQSGKYLPFTVPVPPLLPPPNHRTSLSKSVKIRWLSSFRGGKKRDHSFHLLFPFFSDTFEPFPSLPSLSSDVCLLLHFDFKVSTSSPPPPLVVNSSSRVFIRANKWM